MPMVTAGIAIVGTSVVIVPAWSVARALDPLLAETPTPFQVSVDVTSTAFSRSWAAHQAAAVRPRQVIANPK